MPETEAAVVQEATAPEPEPVQHPDPVPVADVAVGDPLCPICGATLRSERRTPDFATHSTQVCDACGYRLRVAD